MCSAVLALAIPLAAFGATKVGTKAMAGAAHATAMTFRTVRLEVPAANNAAPFNVPRRVSIPRGWTAEVWARVPGARFAIWTPNNQLLVSQPYGDEVFELRPGKTPSAVPRKTVLVSGLTLPQGLAFDKLDGKEVLYIAESDEIDRYVWHANGTLGARTIVVKGLPDTDPSGDDVHRVKEIVVGRNHLLYVDIGSSSNVDTTDTTAHPPRAVVMVYTPSGKGHVYATGVRNGDGLSFDPDGELWTAVNELDNIPYPFHHAYGSVADAFDQVITAYVNNHPPDELVRLSPGLNVGWPYCNPDPDDTPGAADTHFHYANLRFDPDVQTNPGGTNFDCARLKPIERGLPAHTAPLGLTFLEGSALPLPWRNGAVVGAHGSWDRTPPRAPAVLWFPWEPEKRTLGGEIQLVSGFQEPNGSRWGRPVDAVPGPDGALYVTDDTAGAIYRIAPPGANR
jgi:glucose/arabinose dehydrogenase